MRLISRLEPRLVLVEVCGEDPVLVLEPEQVPDRELVPRVLKRASRSEHTANFAANMVERSRRQMFKDLNGNGPVETRRAEGEPTGRGANPIDACRLIQHRR